MFWDLSIFMLMTSLWSIQRFSWFVMTLSSSYNIYAYDDVFLWSHFYSISISPNLFSFHEPWSISDLGLKSRFAYDMYTGELWDYCLYEYDVIIGNMKLDIIIVFASLGLICKFWYNLIMKNLHKYYIHGIWHK